MLSAPFLELAYFVGEANIDKAIGIVKAVVPISGTRPRFAAPDVIGISGLNEQLAIRGGVIELRTEGEEFCGPVNQLKPKARALGKIALHKFLHFASLLEPMYGALLVEYSLESPGELCKDSRSLAFRDFYLARQSLNGKAWKALRELLDERAYVHEMLHGSYISMTPYFNPEGKGISPVDAQTLSVSVANLLAASMGEG